MSKLVSDENFIVELPVELQKQLKNHALEMQRKQQEQMKEKLQRENKKHSRIKEIESNFVKWVEKKNYDNQIRFEKIEKNKEDHLAKIVKKCKDRDKFVAKKHEDFNKTRKKNLNVAWKKAEQFNDDIQNYYKSKNFMSKTAKGPSGASMHELHDNNTQQLQKPERQTEKLAVRLTNNSININTSQMYASQKNNTNIGNKEATLTPVFRETRNDRFVRVQSSSLEESPNTKNAMILDKLRELNKDFEKRKIQELGEKMEKIQMLRARREKHHEKKQSKEEQLERSRNHPGNEHRSKKSPPKNKALKKDGRLYSEQSYKRECRLKDRTMDAKIKRKQMFQQHIAEGYEMIQNLKVRHLKNVIAKNISYNAMEKKLYMERLAN